MTDNKLWYIKQINLFDGISDSELLSIAEKMRDHRYNKKELLYTPFEENTSVYLLKKGEVTLYYSKNGKKLIIDVLKPGSVFGNISFKQQRNSHF